MMRSHKADERVLYFLVPGRCRSLPEWRAATEIPLTGLQDDHGLVRAVVGIWARLICAANAIVNANLTVKR
jgi:hypothetical protein